MNEPIKTRAWRTRSIALALVLLLLALALSGCAKKQSAAPSPALDTTQRVTLTVAGNTPDFRAMELISDRFSQRYPNCEVVYEYLQDYDETLPKRLAADSNRVDLFMTDNIQASSPYLGSALDLQAYPGQLDLSQTFEGLIQNFRYIDESGSPHLYAIPVGAEMRVLYVNQTLLESCGIAVPTNLTQLLAACEALSAKGSIPFQSNPGSFGQQLIFPYIAHLIADTKDDQAVRKIIAACGDEAAELMREPMKLLYELVEKNYYNYKYVENEFSRFTNLTNANYVRSFLGIVEKDGVEQKQDDLGAVPFMTNSIALKPTLDKGIDDFHSGIQYQMILAPVAQEGGYAYMSPARAIAVNNHSSHLDWCLAFLNFLFEPENNQAFADVFSVIPNTRDAVALVSQRYGIPESQIAQPADVTFDYNFYNVIAPTMVDISKANNPKYMDQDADGNAVMYPFEYYMDNLKAAFAKQRGEGEGLVP